MRRSDNREFLTMVELAVALSLQVQSEGAIGLQGLRLACNAQVG